MGSDGPVISTKRIGGEFAGVHQPTHREVAESIAHGNGFGNLVVPDYDRSLPSVHPGTRFAKDLIIACDVESDLDVLIQSQPSAGFLLEADYHFSVHGFV